MKVETLRRNSLGVRSENLVTPSTVDPQLKVRVVIVSRSKRSINADSSRLCADPLLHACFFATVKRLRLPLAKSRT
ncbi:hypothetical protein M0R45_018131 [Rubus argutus]|uniref:Uncharacterized protein n=1 Tax=Rubus argutus TaxID=59490 RepID=A0AAW1X2I8_RUBAR